MLIIGKTDEPVDDLNEDAVGGKDFHFTRAISAAS